MNIKCNSQVSAQQRKVSLARPSHSNQAQVWLQRQASVAAIISDSVPFNFLSETTLNTLVEAMMGEGQGSWLAGSHRRKRGCRQEPVLDAQALLLGFLPPLFDAGVQQGRHGGS